MPTAVASSMAPGYLGEVATLRHGGKRSRVYARRRHEVHVHVGGTDNGVYSFRISTPEGMLPVSPQLVSYTAAGASADTIVTNLTNNTNTAAVVQNGTSIPTLRSTLRATADLTGDDVELVANRSGEPFTVELVGNPNGNLSLTTVENATPLTIPLAIGMIDIDGNLVRLPQAGDTDRGLVGILVRGKAVALDESDPFANGLHREGDTLELVRDGDVWVQPEDDVTPASPVYMRVHAPASEQRGSFRGTPSGVANVWTLTPTVANDLVYRVGINVAGVGTFGPYEVLSDGTATATEIDDGLADLMDADTNLAVYVDAAGAATLVLTGQVEGVSFTPVDAGPGNWTSITETTAARIDTVLCDKLRWLGVGDSTTITQVSITVP